MNIKKIMLIMCLCLCLIMPTVQAEESSAKATKDESVYGLLESDGSVRSLYVVNGFEVTAAGNIVDYGDYSKVVNVTTKDTIQYTEGQVKVPGQVGRFYYQGDLTSKTIPWQFAFTYTLDGVAISGADLIGKSGAVVIQIDVQPSDAYEAFYNNYTLQIGLTVDSEKFSQIDGKGAIIANAGKYKSVTFNHLPGQGKTYTLSANVKDFELNPIQISGIFMAMDVSLDGIDEMTAGFVDLQDGVAQLFSGATKLNEGSTQFATGLDTLAKKCGPLATGSKGVNAGLGQTAAGLNQLLTGSAQLEGLAAMLAASKDPQVQALAGGYLKQMEALKQIAGGLDQMATQYAALNTGIQALNTGIQSLPEGYGQLAEGTAELTAGIGELNASTATIDEEIQTKMDDMLSTYTHKDYVIQSFVDPEHNQVTAVQFVFRTDALKLESDATTAVVVEEVKKSFWDRLLNLFGLGKE